MSIKYYVLVVLSISPQGFLEDLHGYILYSCVCLCNCLYVVTEIKFNSIQYLMKYILKYYICEILYINSLPHD